MHLLKHLMILLIVLISIPAIGVRPSDKETAAAIRQASSLLKQENTRWKNIHSNPLKEEIILIEEEKTFKIILTIDPFVRNIINNQPISREYIIDKAQKPNRGIFNSIISDSDIYFMGGFNTNKDTDIGLLLGYHPNFMYNFGVGPLVCTRSLSMMVYCSAGKIDLSHVIIGLGVGTDYSGPVSNFMIGVMF